jgi:O-acetyl-ADP-ribose deacetylase (regulator of RNase III)
VINYVTGDATEPIGDGPKIIMHCCNDVGMWGKGFVLALSEKWPQAEKEYRAWFERGFCHNIDTGNATFHLGCVQLVDLENDLYVANIIGQRGIKIQTIGGQEFPPIRYEALQEGFARVRVAAKELEASVHCPMLGCGLAGGKWSGGNGDTVSSLICEQLTSKGVDVTVYEYIK